MQGYIIGLSGSGKTAFIIRNTNFDGTLIESTTLPEQRPAFLLIMFDCMSQESFIYAKDLITQARNRWSDIRIVAVGTKTDIPREYHFNLRQFDRFCRRMFVNFYMVSCRTGYQINKPLEKVICLYASDDHTIMCW